MAISRQIRDGVAPSFMDDRPMLMTGVRRLAALASVAENEASVLDEFVEVLAEMDGVRDVVVGEADDDDRPGDDTLTLYTGDEAVYVVGVEAEADRREWVGWAGELLAATASASLTAQRALADARVDRLTRVLNRTALTGVLAAEIGASVRSGRDLHVAVLDLDGFKQVNDEIGHAAGDAVLREAGAVLVASLRPYDHVARVGGDEFVLVTPGLTPADAAVKLERVRSAVARRIATVAGVEGLDCSLGASAWHPAGSADELLDCADAALRRAKREGKRRLVIAEPPRAIDRAPVELLASTPDLRIALRGEGISTLFQPIRNLGSDDIVGYEALSRGPNSLKRPDVMLEHARQAGQLTALDEVLRGRAFASATEAGLRAPLSLFVNIEPETLVALTEDSELWRRDDLSFPSITEVTERALFDRPGRLVDACNRLRELGWGIALDDVGQDPRALALLPILAPDVIKLDLRVLRDRPESETAAIVIAVTAEVQRTGAFLLAEGVESTDHVSRAISLGADLGQGWHYGRPHDDIAQGESNSPFIITRTPRAVAPRGITPYSLIAADAKPREGSATLIRELQADLERRALGLGVVATIATALPASDLDPGAGGRLRHLAHQIGFAVLLADDSEGASDNGYLSASLSDEHPLRDEWVTVVACPHYALTLVARRVAGSDDRWSYALSHDVDTGLQIAQILFLALEHSP